MMTIKTENIESFMHKFLVTGSPKPFIDVSLHHLFQDRLLLKKEAFGTEGRRPIEFKLVVPNDYSNGELLYSYEYSVADYDAFTFKLELTKFNISPVKNNITQFTI